VNLLLFHSPLRERTCVRCQTWLYDDQHQIVTRLGEPVRRPPGSPTPCWKCPKQSPARAAELERAADRVERTLRRYLAVRGTFGACLSRRERTDRLLARHLTLVDRLVRRFEAISAVAALPVR